MHARVLFIVRTRARTQLHFTASIKIAIVKRKICVYSFFSVPLCLICKLSIANGKSFIHFNIIYLIKYQRDSIHSTTSHHSSNSGWYDTRQPHCYATILVSWRITLNERRGISNHSHLPAPSIRRAGDNCHPDDWYNPCSSWHNG